MISNDIMITLEIIALICFGVMALTGGTSPSWVVFLWVAIALGNQIELKHKDKQ